MLNLLRIIKRNCPAWVYRLLSKIRLFFSLDKIVFVGSKSRIFCNPHSYVERLIASGLYEAKRRDFLCSLLYDNIIFVDIGANIGFYTILAAEQVNCVFAFEPDPINFRRLLRNIELNKYESKVRTSFFALGNSNGKANLSRPLTDNFGMASLVTLPSSDSVEVKLCKLDEIPIPFTKFPSVIKIDVEGFELEVLCGSTSALANVQSGSKWIVEVHVGAGISVSSVVDLFDSNLYTVEFFSDTTGRLVALPSDGIDIWLVATKI